MLILLSTIVLLSAPGAAADVARAVKPFEGASQTPKDFAAGMKIVEGLGAKAVDPLIAQLKDAGPAEAGFVCEALGRVGSAGTLPALAAKLASDDWAVRSSCAAGYGSILARVPHDAAAVEPLRVLVNTDAKCEVRTAGALAVGPANDDRLRADWEKALRSSDSYSCDRRVAFAGLRAAKAHADTVGPLMLPALNDEEEDPVTRESAADAVGELAFAPAREPLLALLDGKDPGANVRAEAIESLGTVGLPKDVARLQKVIKEDPNGNKGIWAMKARAAIKRIETRAKSAGRK